MLMIGPSTFSEKEELFFLDFGYVSRFTKWKNVQNIFLISTLIFIQVCRNLFVSPKPSSEVKVILCWHFPLL